MRRYNCDPVNRPDYCSLEGAEALKAKIEAALIRRGLSPLPRLQLVAHHTSDATRVRFDIRSDMVNGLPPPVQEAQRQ